jgi:hypothetical protein
LGGGHADRVGRDSEVVREQAAHRHVGLAVVPREATGVLLDQIVHRVPAGGGLDQVRVDEPVEHGRRIEGGQCLHRVDRDVVSGDEAEQTEHPALGLTQRLVGLVKDRAHSGVRIPRDRERGQPVTGPQGGDVIGDANMGPVDEVGRGDAQREGQITTDAGQFGRRVLLRRDALRTHDPTEQVDGLGRCHGVQHEAPGTVAGDEAAQAVATGHDHQAVRVAG